MTDITETNLEAAFIDQHVAGAFMGKRYAFIFVYGDDGWQLGVAVANERGYHPLAKVFANEFDVKVLADGLNAHLGLADDVAARIVISTMGGRSV